MANFPFGKEGSFHGRLGLPRQETLFSLLISEHLFAFDRSAGIVLFTSYLQCGLTNGFARIIPLQSA